MTDYGDRMAYQTHDCPLHGRRMPFIRAPQGEQQTVRDEAPGKVKLIEEFVCIYCYFDIRKRRP